MDKERIFEMLQKADATTLIDLLDTAYDEMNTNQRHNVFDTFERNMPPAVIDEKILLDKVEEFNKESIAGTYYAPFNINSQNFMKIPEETDQWFDLLGDYLEQSSLLSEQGGHHIASQCFNILYELIDLMEDGDEIVFADELGSWMIPIDMKACMRYYITSLAVISTPEQFTASVLPLLHRDSFESLTNKVYATIKKVASKEQLKSVNEEVIRQNIQTKSKRK